LICAVPSFSARSVALRRLHAFPTRRSSDLRPPVCPGGQGVGQRPRQRGGSVRGDRRDQDRRPADQDQGGDPECAPARTRDHPPGDRKSTRLNSSHLVISYAVFCLKKKKCKRHWPSLLDRWSIARNLRPIEARGRTTINTTRTSRVDYVAWVTFVSWVCIVQLLVSR